jgi:hypothetical protein
MDGQNQATNDKGSKNSNNLPADTQSSSTTEVNTYCSSNHIFLATAIVEVKYKFGQYVPFRALLDSASQSHFITVRCAQHLRLSRIQTHASIHGISNVNTAAPHTVSIHLLYRHSDWHTTVDYVVLPNIKGTTPLTKLDTSS